MFSAHASVKACSPTRTEGGSPSASLSTPVASRPRTRTSDSTRDCSGGGAAAAAAAVAAAATEAKPLRGEAARFARIAAPADLMLGREEPAGALSQ